MRNTLVILNYQREIPAFMQNVINCGAMYERIIYITPEFRNDNRDACQVQNLQVLQVPRKVWRWSLAKLPFMMLRKEVRTQVSKAVQSGRLDASFLRNLIVCCVCGEVLRSRTIELFRRKEVLPEDTVLLAAWFHTEAYACSQIKKAYREVHAVSYAHAFEINEAVNKNVLYDLNMFKHEMCDKISFISKTTQARYISALKRMYPEIRLDNIEMNYLGSRKLFSEDMAESSSDGWLRIVSCSSAVPVKRIHLIIEALSLTTKRIDWVHIGGGPLLEELKAQAARLLNNKSNIRYAFTGQMSNDRVQEYYIRNCVDIFINVSESEGLPVSLMECMSYGIPAIATDVGGSKELVNQETGFLIPKDFKAAELAELLHTYAAMPMREKYEYRAQAAMSWKTCFDGNEKSTAFLKEQQNS